MFVYFVKEIVLKFKGQKEFVPFFLPMNEEQKSDQFDFLIQSSFYDRIPHVLEVLTQSVFDNYFFSDIR